MEFSIAAPAKYQFDDAFLAQLKREVPHAKVIQTTRPADAAKGAIGIYTDVWVSMGQESEEVERKQEFGPYQVNAALMKHAPASATFLHCLPARRGEEVTDEVIDSPQSAVIPQAGNRMHVQKGLLAWLLGANV